MRFARSMTEGMEPEVARNENNDDHDADDSKDVHSA
jgi:hypothetical protein